MASVGTAYVNIRINTKGFEGQLDKMMSRLGKNMEKHGRDMGMQFNKGLSSVNPGLFFDRFAAEADKATKKSAASIDQLGDAFDRAGVKAHGFGEDTINVMDVVGESTRDAKTDVNDLGSSFTSAKNEAKGLKSAMGGIGGGRGSGGLRSAGEDAGFFSSMLRSLSNEAESGAAVLHHLYDAEAFLGTGLAALVSGASAAVQGLFALASQAVATLPALAALTNAGMTFAQVGGAIALSMGGVGKAVTAGLAPARTAATAAADATNGIASAVASALRSVRDAKQGLSAAYESAARAAEDAARRVADAERAVGDAQQAVAADQAGVRAAQLALNAARAVGLEQLEDIAFAAEDAALAEERASLNLEDAYNALKEVQSLPPDDRARREAELAYKEAELQMREAKDRRQDADKEQKQAAKNGVKGTDAMQSAYADLADAQNSLRDSQQALLDSQRNLNEAREAESRVAEDNARKIRDALESVADAQDRLSQARKSSATSATAAETAETKYRDALNKLSKPQQEFVKRIIANKDTFLDFRKAVAAPMFVELNKAFDELIAGGAGDTPGLMDRIKDGLADTSGILGTFIERLVHLGNTPVFGDRLSSNMDANNEALKSFTGTGENLVRLFNNIAFAAQPLIKDFAKWTEKVTQSWWAARHTNDQLTDMRKRFIDAGKRVVVFKDFFVQLYEVTKTIGKAALRASENYQGLTDKVKGSKETKGFIPRMTEALDKFNDKLKEGPNFHKLVKGFDQALQNMEALAKAGKNAILDPLIKMGQDPQIETAFSKFADTDVFDRLAAAANDAAPELADLALSLAEILADLSESGSIQHFLDWLGKAADGAEWFFGILADSGVLKFFGYITAGAATFRILSSVIKIALSPMILMGKRLGTLGGQWSRFANKDAQPGKMTGKWNTFFSNFTRTAQNSVRTVANGFIAMKNGFAKAVNAMSFGKLNLKTDTAKFEKIPPPDVTPPVATPADQTAANRAGLSMTEAFAQGIREGLPAKDAAMNALRQNVLTMLNQMNPVLEAKANTVGVNIVVGLVSGIEEFTAEVIAAAKAAGKAAAEAVGNGAGVASPSRITMVDGNQIMAGLTVGIEEGTAAATLAAEAAGAKVAGAVGAGARVGTLEAEAAGAAAVTSAVPAPAVAAPLTAPATAATSSLGKFGKMMGPLTKLAKPLAGGMRLIGGAFRFMLGPVGMIVLTLLPLLWPLLQKLEAKTHIFSKALDGLSWVFGKVADGAKWLSDKVMDFLQPIIDWVTDHWGTIQDIMIGPFAAIGGFIADHLDTVKDIITGAIDFVKDHWQLILAILLGPFGIAIGLIIKNFDKIKAVFTTVIGWVKKHWKTIQFILTLPFKLVVAIIKTVLGKITAAVGAVIGWVKDHWKLILSILTGPFGALIIFVISHFDKIKSIVTGVIDWVKDHWQAVFKFLTDPIGAVVGFIRENFDKIKGFVTNLLEKFGDIGEGIGNAFKGLGNFAKEGINDFIGFINDNLIDKVNSVTSKFGLTISPIPEIGLAEGGRLGDALPGGRIRGAGGSRDDRVPLMGSHDEFMVKASSARKLGYSQLSYMNRTGKLPPMGGDISSVGGTVKAGTSALGRLGGFAGDVAKKGLGKTLEGIIKAITGLMSGAGIKRGTFLADWFYGIMDKLAEAAKNWGGDTGEDPSGGRGAGQRIHTTGRRTPYGGAVAGWTRPIAGSYPTYTFPGHNPAGAYDIAAPKGTWVQSVSSGVVRGTYNSGSKGYGRYMVVDHPGGMSTLYAHLSSFAAMAGKFVSVGEKIARTGNSGGVRGGNGGAHLHFETLPGGDAAAFLRRMGVKFAEGGIARATDGGILSVIAEAGQSERVEPLDSHGMSKRDHVLLETIKGLIQNAQGGDQWNIHPAPGMNEIEFAKQVRREVVFHRRRGA